MSTPTDPRAVAAARKVKAMCASAYRDAAPANTSDEYLASLVAAEYAPLVEAARRAMRYFDEQESDEPGTTEMRLTVLIALRAALEGSTK